MEYNVQMSLNCEEGKDLREREREIPGIAFLSTDEEGKLEEERTKIRGGGRRRRAKRGIKERERQRQDFGGIRSEAAKEVSSSSRRKKERKAGLEREREAKREID